MVKNLRPRKEIYIDRVYTDRMARAHRRNLERLWAKTEVVLIRRILQRLRGVRIDRGSYTAYLMEAFVGLLRAADRRFEKRARHGK